MVTLALYRHQSIIEVLDTLGLAVPDAQAPFFSKSAATQARQRLGSDPLKWLFEHAAHHWCSRIAVPMSSKDWCCTRWTALLCVRMTMLNHAGTSGHKIMPAVPLPATPGTWCDRACVATSARQVR
ncbi:MAG: transposase domain-containing protein [Pseudomonadota bacterium]|nr:transposase domain-containing protein [Pseudomonadota bacterium]